MIILDGKGVDLTHSYAPECTPLTVVPLLKHLASKNPRAGARCSLFEVVHLHRVRIHDAERSYPIQNLFYLPCESS